MKSVEIIGFMAGILVAVSILPQIIKSWKTKSTKDISINWSILNLFGQILWIVYGVQLESYSLVVMSGIAMLMNMSMITLKVRYG